MSCQYLAPEICPNTCLYNSQVDTRLHLAYPKSLEYCRWQKTLPQILTHT